jgi:hypothetical protein
MQINDFITLNNDIQCLLKYSVGVIEEIIDEPTERDEYHIFWDAQRKKNLHYKDDCE